MAGDDYLEVLRTIKQLPFPLGRNALIALLAGDAGNETIKRNRLDRESCFGALSGHGEDEIASMIQRLTTHGCVERAKLHGTHLSVYRVTERGERELQEPSLTQETLSFKPTPITQEDRILFEALDFFLKRYNEQQKQAIVSRANRILCVAGAGTGKTTVLTKRIEFLTDFVGVKKEKILAITFTRKAREEMQRRLSEKVQVETFNSFCERILQRHGSIFYDKPVRVLGYGDRMRLLHHAVRSLGLDLATVIDMHFTSRQRAGKSRDQLARLLLADCFSILDYYANDNRELEDFSKDGNIAAKTIYLICRAIHDEMRMQGLRDYADQLRDAILLLKKHPNLIPRYEHILVDEYQDVNTIQHDLLTLLAPPNLFVVGDPRQSIFGWRGSRIRFILDFPKNPCEIIVLQTNYRSAQPIVQLANATIRTMQLPDLLHRSEQGATLLHTLRSDTDEMDLIAQRILASTTPREHTFVLTRTNRQLQDLSVHLTSRNIPHAIRSDETKLTLAQEGQVLLSTVHAIKGLEADVVFVAFCNTQSFPCIASDHPVLELVRKEEHDREEEERRLFYVALTRARRELHLTYSGTPTRFLTDEMKKLLGVAHNKKITETYSTQGEAGKTFQKLRQWRANISRTQGIPAYLVFSDATLLALASEQPQDVEDLHQISGIGPVKAQKYGEELLDLLHNP